MAKISAPRYHRRVLVVGLLAAALLYGIGAPIFADRVQSDLETRVPDELESAGYPSISASFDGQDGTLSCAAPLQDPEGATQAAYEVWGVRSIDLDRSCRVLSASDTPETTTPTLDSDVSSADTGDESATDDSTARDSGGSDESAPASSVSEPTFATVGEVIATDPQFSLLAVLMNEAGLASLVDDESNGPATVFAATDAAFDSLAADELARLRSDPELLTEVIRHHAITGMFALADLPTGPQETFNGDTVDIEVTESATTVDDATIVDADIEAGNGMVHAIDRVLLPESLDQAPAAPTSVLTATYVGGTMTFAGVVASEAERAALADAIGEPAVVDVVDVDVDAEQGRSPADVGRLARLAAAMPGNLTSGVADFDEEALSISGVYINDAQRDAVIATADAVDATYELAGTPPTTDTEVQAIEDELNAIVADDPILFAPGSADLTPDSLVVIETIAEVIGPIGDVTVTVEGHTDSDGDPADNQVLSEARARAVWLTLISFGVPESALAWEGFGSDERVIVDGSEDKAASRRIEFDVESAGA